MKAIVKARPEEGGLELRDLPVPEPGPGEALVKMKTVAICGTDLHIYNWDAWSQGRVKLPCTLGHEFAGEVVSVGPNTKHVKVGDYVSGEGHLVCGFCRQCRTGEGHVCEDWKGLGYDMDGCFTEYLAYPEANLWKNDPDLSPDQAACQDPLGNAVHTVFAADCVGNTVAVYGLGPVGLMAIGVLRAIGAAKVIAVGRRNEYRLEMARKMGAHHVIASSKVDPVEAVRALTGGAGADVAIEIAGTEPAIQSAIKSVRLGGTAVLLGIPNAPVPVDLAKDVVFRAVTIKGVTGRRIWDTWYQMAGLFKSGNLDISPIITHHLPFDQYEEGFKLMQSGDCGKVVLEL
jgi:threonine 3-dehydrogenase